MLYTKLNTLSGNACSLGTSFGGSFLSGLISGKDNTGMENMFISTVVDKTRSSLYTLSSSGLIQLHFISGGNNSSAVTCFNYITDTESYLHSSKAETDILCMKPSSIHVVPSSQSSVIGLVAITGSGYQYYLSYTDQLSPNLSLKLLREPQSQHRKSVQIHSSKGSYSNGVLAFASNNTLKGVETDFHGHTDNSFGSIHQKHDCKIHDILVVPPPPKNCLICLK